jgi:hypothetical protein
MVSEIVTMFCGTSGLVKPFIIQKLQRHLNGYIFGMTCINFMKNIPNMPLQSVNYNLKD